MFGDHTKGKYSTYNTGGAIPAEELSPSPTFAKGAKFYSMSQLQENSECSPKVLSLTLIYTPASVPL